MLLATVKSFRRGLPGANVCLYHFRATKLTRFAARHGFQYVLVNPSPGVRFSGELDALTAHWTTANLEETATIEFGGEGAGMLASIRDIARASQISNVAAYLPTDCPTRCVRHDIIGLSRALESTEPVGVHAGRSTAG